MRFTLVEFIKNGWYSKKRLMLYAPELSWKGKSSIARSNLEQAEKSIEDNRFKSSSFSKAQKLESKMTVAL